MTHDLLAPSGNAAKFETIGTTHKGTVISRETRQQKDYATGTPKTWDDGQPMMEVVIGLQPADSELVTLYVRGKMLGAVKEAVAKSTTGLPIERRTVEIGGQLAVKYYADGEPSKAGFTAPKLYQAQYAPPAATVVKGDDLLAAPATPAAAPIEADDLL